MLKNMLATINNTLATV